MRIHCEYTTERLTESRFEGDVIINIKYRRTDGVGLPSLKHEDRTVVEKSRRWDFAFCNPCDTLLSKLTISYDDVVIVDVRELVLSGNRWLNLPNRDRFSPRARAVLDLCLPGILGTVAEILAMDNGTTVAFAIAQFMGIPATIETKLQLDIDIEDKSRVRELRAVFE